MLPRSQPCNLCASTSATAWIVQRRLMASAATANLRQRTAAGLAPSRPITPQPPPPPTPKATHIPQSTLSYYWDTTPPTPKQLVQADRFFLAHPPSIVYSAIKFRTVKLTSAPEVAFLGRSNVGKSTLLNALMGRNLCRTSHNPGRTRSMNFFAIGGEDGAGNPGKLMVLDMPGYGKGSREEWGREIEKYLLGRKQLRRAFLLINAHHGIKESDEQMLAMFRHNAIPHQVILSKVDRVLLPGSKIPTQPKLEKSSEELKKLVEDVRSKIQPKRSDGPDALGEILTCSAEKAIQPGAKLGISNIRWAVLAATGLGKKARDIRAEDIFEEEDNNEAG